MHPDRKAYLSGACQPILDSLAQQCTGLLWASVSTRDGIEIASIGGAPNEKLSVIVSTMHALSDSIVAEADLGQGSSTILEAEGGRVVILAVLGASDGLVLAGMSAPSTSLGMLLSLCTKARQEVMSACNDDAFDTSAAPFRSHAAQ